jgi:cyanate permease
VRINFLAVVSLFLLALNLRPAITAVGPLVGSIQDTTGLSAAALGFLSSLPLLAFSAFAPLAKFGRRFGIERTVAIAMLMLAVGIVVRSGGSTAALFAGTVVLAAGIAVGNVLTPSIIKRDYPERVGPLTTIYALILALSAAMASGLAVPSERALPGGWRSALAIWAVPAAIAAVLWARAFLRPHRSAPPVDDSAAVSVWRSPLAWCVTGFMGLQSLCFYVSIAWLPKVFQDGGYDAAVAGLLITGFQVVSIVAGVLMPRLLSLRTARVSSLDGCVGGTGRFRLGRQLSFGARIHRSALDRSSSSRVAVSHVPIDGISARSVRSVALRVGARSVRRMDAAVRGIRSLRRDSGHRRVQGGTESHRESLILDSGQRRAALRSDGFVSDRRGNR